MESMSTITLHLLLLLSFYEAAAKVPAIIVFGDSSVDAGNNNYIPTILRSNFEPYGRDFSGQKPTGRFCNGRLATDFISEAFGLPPTIPPYLDPSLGIESLVAGVCFASAGTGYDNATSDVLSVIPLWKELEHFNEYRRRLNGYLGERKGNQRLREALYIISLGTNDFLENYYAMTSQRSSQFSVEKYQDFLIGIAGRFVRDIYHIGARKIDLTGLIPIGCLPLERTVNVEANHACNAEYNKVASDFNRKLQQLGVRLNRELAGIRLVTPNIYDLVLDIITNPSKYGFEDAVTGCCGTGLFEMGILCNKKSLFTCRDASKYVFWDAFHPTERMNSVLADHSMKTSLSVFR